eukprot:XP_006504053.1 PREDICTED: zygote arrest protein 1 isoform X1 [Mus musculus]
MAAWAGEARDAPMFPASTFHPCPHPYPQATKAGDGWRFGARGCRPAPPSFLPGYRQLMAAEYVDSHQRAQLMALLSRMGPRSVSSRDAAVQVNPRRDASVQCSLGRRTLQPAGCRASPDARSGSCQPRGHAGAGRSPRSWQTVAPFSSVTFCGLSSSLEVAGGRQTPTKGEGSPASSGTREPEPREVAARKAVPQPRSEEGDVQAAGQAGWEQQPPPEDRNSVAAMQSEPGSEEPCPAAEMAQDPGDSDAPRDQASPQSTEQDKERLRFQSCKRTRCACPVRLRHVDPKRPHRQDLCGRCKDKRLSCDSTFSFKYII